jgi:hypothetical protein
MKTVCHLYSLHPFRNTKFFHFKFLLDGLTDCGKQHIIIYRKTPIRKYKLFSHR